MARAVIEQETGHKIDELFQEFRDKPLGSASVGQAHYAVLKDGTKVVCKVRRPLIADMMRKDFVLLKKMARVFNVYAEGNENSEDQIDLLEVIEEFEKVTNEELDFRVEAKNTKFFKENCITDGDINIIQTLVMAVLQKDAESLANGVMSMGAASAKTNRDRLIEDIDVYLDKYCTVTSLDDLDMSVLFDEIMNLAAKHHVTMPGKFTMLVRSLTTIEGVIEQLCPSLNLFKIVSSKMMDRAKKSFDLEKTIINAGKDVLEVGKKASRIPALAADALKGINRGRMKMNMEFTGYENLLIEASETIKNILLALFACVLFFGSCILCTADIRPKAPGGIPCVAAVGMVFSIALAIHTVNRFKKK